MKKEILKKMKAYSAAAGAVVAVGASADAQVSWSGPINELVTSSFNIDLDGDGVNDFVLAISQSGTYQSANISPVATGNQWLGTLSNGDQYVKALNPEFIVDASAVTWTNQAFGYNIGWYLSASFYNLHSFLGAGDKFIGVRFDVDGSTHYGWIRVNVHAQAENMTVVDWAYEGTADAGITTGNIGDVPTLSGISSANITQTTADILFTPNVNGTAYIVVLGEGDTAPTAEEVVAGTGSGGANAVFSGNIAVTEATEATFNVTGLSSGTVYTGYIVLDDGAVKTLSYVYDIDFSTSVGIQDLSSTLNIFPNPSTGLFNLSINDSNYEVSVKDITGRTILEGKNLHSIDLSRFGAGSYTLHIKTQNGLMNKKIIVK